MRPFLAACVSIVVALGGARLGRAQVPVYYSIEENVAAADVVDLGTITDVSERPPPGNEGSSYTITVRVSETIKGSPVNELRVVNDRFYQREDFLRWAQRKSPILWCVTRPDHKGDGYRFGRIVPLDATEPTDSRFAIHVFDMDLAMLRSPTEVLDHARRFVKEATRYPSGGFVTLWTLERPWRLITNPTGRPASQVIGYVPELFGSGGLLEVPVVPRLEAIAKRLILHPDSVIPPRPRDKSLSPEQIAQARKTDEEYLRAQGICCLAYFKSERNIKLVEGYLNDPAIVPSRFAPGSTDQPVRSAAQWLLEGWDIKRA